MITLTLIFYIIFVLFVYFDEFYFKNILDKLNKWTIFF
jgi:hypothetical protein